MAHRILEDGSFAEDDIMVEYLSGVLACSRTPSGTVDRGAAWASMVTGMSSYEIRAHFLIYRELADGLRGTDLNVADLAQRRKARIELDGNELVNAIAGVAGVDGHDELHPQFWHAIHGLRRRGLLGEDLLVAVRDEANPDLPYEAVVS